MTGSPQRHGGRGEKQFKEQTESQVPLLLPVLPACPFSFLGVLYNLFIQVTGFSWKVSGDGLVSQPPR